MYSLCCRARRKVRACPADGTEVGGVFSSHAVHQVVGQGQH